jgi:hypothetical protein
MAITDAQYLAWLAADNKNRALLGEAKAYSGGVEVTRYFANKAYVSGPGETPANTTYDDILAQVPNFTTRMSEVFGGHSTASWGDLILSNESGVRDSWLNDAWDGRALNLYFGDPAWARSDFRSILAGYSADLVALDRSRLALRARDKSWALNVPLQTSLIGGSTANKDKLKPVCYGQVFNIEPPLIVAATHEYQVHDGAIEDVTDVRDNGLTVAYTKDLANGKFTLNAAPAGRITCDAKGAKPSGVYHVKCADIVQDILTTRTALVASDLDSASFTAFNTTCAQTLGFFSPGFISVAAAVDELVSSVGGFWAQDRDGMIVLGQFVAPTGTPELELNADDVALNGISIQRRILPVDTIRLGYKKNYSVQVDGLAGAVTESNRAVFAAGSLTVSASNGGVSTTHLLAEFPPQIETLLVVEAEAQTEVSRRATLWSTLRYIYQVNCFTAPFKLRLGQVIQLTHPRFGFSAGKLATVVGFREQPTLRRAILELFA